MHNASTLKSQVLDEIVGGCLDKEAMARELEVTQRTISSYQRAGLPCFWIARKRYFDPAKTRAWLATRLARKVA